GDRVGGHHGWEDDAVRAEELVQRTDVLEPVPPSGEVLLGAHTGPDLEERTRGRGELVGMLLDPGAPEQVRVLGRADGHPLLLERAVAEELAWIDHPRNGVEDLREPGERSPERLRGLRRERSHVLPPLEREDRPEARRV